MNRILDALRRFFLAVGRALALAWEASLRWLAVPVNLCLAVLGLVFVLSFLSWAIGAAFEEAVLFFPDARGGLRGELRDVPHSWGSEARAELIASELLLGPANAALSPAFLPGTKVESALYRRGRLFIDLSPEAALDAPSALKNGISAMERSIRAALPGVKRLSLTIGGKEPYAVGLKAEGGKGIKKPENN
jgi:hypothetical protein